MATARLSRRTFLAAGGVLIVRLGLDAPSLAPAQTVPGADRFLGKPLAPDQVDSFLAVHADGSVTIFVGKVDIGTGGRIAMRQIVGEELDIPLERIAMIEGDTALTPNQGPPRAATASRAAACRSARRRPPHARRSWPRQPSVSGGRWATSRLPMASSARRTAAPRSAMAS